MKKITKKIIFLALLAVSSLQVIAQSTTNEALEDVITSTKVVEASAKEAQLTLKTVFTEYLLGQTPNTSGFISVINRELGTVEEYSDEFFWFADAAERLSNGDLDLSDIKHAASQIEGTGDYVETNSQLLVNAINANNQSEVINLFTSINNDLQTILHWAEEAKEEAEAMISPSTFNVKIELVDRYGNSVPVETLPGYAANDINTNEYHYAGVNQGDPINVFYNLPQGTYRFDARDGYFDGASSETVELSNSLVNSAGFITITLTYWSE